jgi:hypothetical protein
MPIPVTTTAATDYTEVVTSVTTAFSGLGAALLVVVAAALTIKGITWGVPKIVRFFTKLA